MKKTKLIAVVLSLCMLLALVPVAALAAEFTDADEVSNESYADAIDRWADEGVIKGNADGSFDPKGTMSRVQGFGIIAELLNLTEKADLSEYTDVPTDGWKADYLAKVVAAGIVTGYPDKTLRPEGELTREQMFVTIAKTLGVQPVETDDEEFEDIGEAADYAAPYINALHKMGAVNGSNGNVNPLDTLSREGAALLLDNLIGGYANTEGDTVEIEKGKITLVVADNVAVKGEVTEEDMPIVVAGQAGTVDMKEVTGDVAPTVNVTVPEVKIENAPVGTTVAAAEDVADVTVNDQTVEAGEEVVVPEPEPTPTPTIPTPPPTESVTAAAIDEIIEAGRVAVNAEMHGDDSIPYAYIPEFEKTGTPRNVTVTVYDSTATVGDIYTDIIGTLVKALQDNANKVSTITAVTDIEGQTVNTETDGQNYKKTLTLGSSISNNDVILFVKALVGQSFHRVTDISGLIGKNFVVEVADVESGSFATKVQYKVTFKMASLDDVIAEEIPNISKKMSSYATAEWDGDKHTLNVVITGSDTELGTVYDNIGTTLVEAFNLVRKQLTKVEDGVSDGNSELTITEKIDGDKLVQFVKGLKIKDSSSDSSQGLTDLLASGRGSKVILLLGHEFNIKVTAKGTPTGASQTADYIIKFTSKLDSVIAREIPNISETMKAKGYASADWDSKTHTLKVTISNGDYLVGGVYEDIAGLLCTAFNEARTTLSAVKDALTGGSSELKDLDKTDLTDTALKTFVKELKIKANNNDVKDVMTVLGQSLKISGLDKHQFEINVTGKGQSEAVKYTISFTVATA